MTLAHALSLINGRPSATAPAPRPIGSPNRGGEKEDQKVVDIYYSVLNRPPTENERSTIDFSAGGTRLEVAQDLAWALMNSPAFLFN